MAILGVLLPLLPSFPFILLSSYCFSKSSKRYSLWLRENRFFGESLRSYEAGLGITKGVKCKAISVLWLSICVSMYLVQDKILLVAMLFCIASGVTLYLLRLPTHRVTMTAS